MQRRGLRPPPARRCCRGRPQSNHAARRSSGGAGSWTRAGPHRSRTSAKTSDERAAMRLTEISTSERLQGSQEEIHSEKRQPVACPIGATTRKGQRALVASSLVREGVVLVHQRGDFWAQCFPKRGGTLPPKDPRFELSFCWELGSLKIAQLPGASLEAPSLLPLGIPNISFRSFSTSCFLS